MTILNDEYLKHAKEREKYFKSNNYARMHGRPPMRGKANKARKYILKLAEKRDSLSGNYVSVPLGISTLNKNLNLRFSFYNKKIRDF